MGSEWPSLNPFPAQATTAIEEGAFSDSYRAWAKKVPTLELDPVRSLLASAVRIRDADEGPLIGRGQAVFLYGEHGAGKTHAIRAAVGLAMTEPARRRLVPLYTKLGSTSFVHAYRHLMAQLTRGRLAELVLGFLGAISRSTNAIPGWVDVDRLRNDPQAVLKMMSSHLLERGLLLDVQARRLQAVVQYEENFQRALTYLFEPDLEEAAFAWLQGRRVADADLRRLGLTNELNDPDSCCYGLLLLTLVCAEAGEPLVVILDQAEKFLAGPDGLPVAESRKVLHDLVDVIPQQGGMLIVAANTETWWALTPDLRQRFGTSGVACGGLQPGHAVELLGLYVAAALGVPAEEYQPPWPFAEDAVHRLLRTSGGNPRALLQLSWQAFERATAERGLIHADDVPAIIESFDQGDVEMKVKRALWRLGPVEVNPADDFRFGVSLPDGSRLLVRISEALFYRDEVDRADDSLAALDRSRAELSTVPARYVLVVSGYASQDVLYVMQQEYDEVVVYRDEQSLADAVGRLAGDAHGILRSSGRRTGVEQRLSDLGQERAIRADHLADEIAERERQRQRVEARQLMADLFGLWPAERQRIVDQIGRARRERERAELEDLAAAAGANRRRQIGWLVLMAVATGGGILGLLQVNDDLKFLVAAFAAAAATVAAMLGGWVVASRAGTRPARSIADAVMIGRRRRAKVLWSRRNPLLASDPYVRLGELFHEDLRPGVLKGALRVEQVRILRREMVTKLGQKAATDAFRTAAGLLDDRTPEVAYFVQFLVPARVSELHAFPAALRTLAMLNGLREGQQLAGTPTSTAVSTHEVDTLHYVGASEVPPADPPVHRDTPTAWKGLGYVGASEILPDDTPTDRDPAVTAILDAASGRGPLGLPCRTGLTLVNLPAALDAVGQETAVRVRRLLSPFGDLGGLGSIGVYDHLEHAEDIDRLYLFFEQLGHFRQGGLQPEHL